MENRLKLSLTLVVLSLLRPAPTTADAPTAAAAIPSPARIVGEERARWPFSLLAVTSVSESYGFLTPPKAVATISGSAAPEPIMAVGRGTGLWIHVRDGVGYRTITPPADRQRHTYPLGRATLVVDETYTAGYSVRWTGPDGSTPLPEGQRPYEATATSTTASLGRPAALAVTLIPNRTSLPFVVTARPLSARGEALGGPVSLICQVVGPKTVFAEIPAGYSAATGQFQVAVTRRGTGRVEASWRLTDLPASVRNGGDHLLPVIATGYGPLTIRGAAAEAEDLSGIPDFFNRHPERDAGGGWFFDQPLNADGHGWSGVPSIRFLLAAHNASNDVRGQNWVVRIDRVTPQWSASPVTQSSPTVMPLQSFPIYNPQNLPPGESWVTHDWQIGVAYPGQQHWVRIEGEMIRSAYRTETVTFHDAKVVHDTALGGDRLVWGRPETETTPSGVSVTVVNARPGVRDQSGTTPGSPDWRFDHGSAELLLVWHLPTGLTSEEHAPLDAEATAEPPHAMGSLSSEWDSSHPPPRWDAFIIPGRADAKALLRAGDMPLRLSVRSTAKPDLSHLPLQEGLFRLPPVPLPRHLRTVTLQLTLRERQESHPFRLLVPVRATFPPGWNADAADSRSGPSIRAAVR